MTQLTIGQVARATGLTTKTIRFYEDHGVISKATRTDNGYRAYPPSAVEELKIIKYARDLDLPLSEIKRLLVGCAEGQCHHSRQYLENFTANYISLIDDKVNKLNLLKQKLSTFQSHLHDTTLDCTDGPYCCNIFHQVINYLKQEGGDTHVRT